MVTLVGAAVAFILAFCTKMRKFASFRTVTSIIPYRTFYFFKKKYLTFLNTTQYIGQTLNDILGKILLSHVDLSLFQYVPAQHMTPCKLIFKSCMKIIFHFHK